MTPLVWQSAPGEESVQLSPVWFRLIDDVSGRGPIAPVTVQLDLQEGTSWTPLDIPAIITEAGMVTFPSLDRRRPVAGVPPRHYRVRVESAYYRPLYRQLTSGVEFQAGPIDESTATPPLRQDLQLLPSVSYPFPAHVRRLRGEVRDQSGSQVEDVVVSNQVQVGATSLTERTLTDERGAFSLALRWVTPGTTTTVTAMDHRTQHTATINVAVPNDLRRSKLITIV